MPHPRTLKLIIYIIIIAAFGARFANLLPGIKLRFDNFFQFRGNYDLLRNQYNINLNEPNLDQHDLKSITASGAWEAGHVIPLDAGVDIRPTPWTLPKIASRYILFPRPALDDAPYILDLDGSLTELPRGGTWAQFGSGTKLYAKAGYGFASYPSAQRPHWSWAALTVAAFLIIYTLTGLLFCAALKIDFQRGALLKHFLTCYLAGFLLLNAAITLCLILGVPLTRIFLLSLCVVILLILAFAARGNLHASMVELKNSWMDFKQVGLGRTGILLGSGAILLIGLLALSIGFSPVMDWDGMLHWAYQAKLFFYHQGFAFAYPNLNYYPPLWPVAMASHLTLGASLYDASFSWMGAVNFILFCAQFLLALKIIGCPPRQTLMPLLLFLAFFFHTDSFFYWTYAEAIFLVFLLGLVSNVCLWLKEEKNSHAYWLAVMCACAISLIKLEGVIMAGLIAFSALLVNRDIKRAALLSLIPVALIIGWVGWIRMSDLLIPISHLEHGPGLTKLNFFFTLLFSKTLNIGWTQLIFILIIASALLFKPTQWNRTTQFLGYAFLGLALFSVAAVLGVYPERMEEQLERVTPRLFVHAGAVLILWWASVVGKENLEKK